MPPYAFLAERELKAGDMARDLTALYRVGVPYTKIDIAKANDDIRAQADPNAGAGDLVARYHKAQVRDFDGDPPRVPVLDALIASLTTLGRDSGRDRVVQYV